MIRARHFFLALLVFLSAPAAAAVQEQTAARVSINFSLAMHGAPKYPEGFAHFDYVNPEAPKGGRLKLAALGTFDSLNPFILRGTPPLGLSMGFMSLVYQPLMARSHDEPFSLYGLLAIAIETPADRSSVTFHLNPNARWQDGKPVTADDVLFSWQTLRDMGLPNMRIYYKKVERAERLGDRRVRFSFGKNASGGYDHEMPLIMGLMPVLPKHDWEGRDFNDPNMRIPVGSGPYKVAHVDPGRAITYKRDPGYWGRDLPSQKGLNNFDEIQIDYYRDDKIALQAFKANQFDWRREFDANNWATAYDFPAVKDGRVKLESVPHHRTEPAYALALNSRRAPFSDPVFRAALQYTFDFSWINKALFHGQLKRMQSFFPNSELAAPPLPGEKESGLLEKFRAQLPPDIFTSPVTPPGSDDMRANLLKAEEMLRSAGYALREGVLYAPGENAGPVTFEILLGDPAEEKVALEWARALKRLGIAARVHAVDSAQYQARLNNFDFDVTAYKWINSLSPGNEQIFFWSAAAADQSGSRNYPGVKDPVVDALAAAIPAATSREDLVADTHALDRVLMAGHYVVPLYYAGTEWVAYWAAHLRHPEPEPLYGAVLESWWAE